MPRRRVFQDREVAVDPRHRDKMVAKFVNVLMSKGKKSTAERVCYGAFDIRTWAKAYEGEDQEPCTPPVPSTPRGLPESLHVDPKETELRAPKGCTRPAHQRHGGYDLHPRCGP